MTICNHCDQDLICIGCRHIEEECTCISLRKNQGSITRKLTLRQWTREIKLDERDRSELLKAQADYFLIDYSLSPTKCLSILDSSIDR